MAATASNGGEELYSELLGDARLYEFLYRCDVDLAAAARAEGCLACGAVIHSARYGRKPRGGPRELGPEYERRESFCCAREGCRKRLTPPSLRYLGRRVYLGAVVIVVSAMMHGAVGSRAAKLRELTGASPRTINRWRRWWREEFVERGFWKVVAGRFERPVTGELLPLSLLERFSGEAFERLVACLRFVCPITTESAGGAIAF